MYATIVYNYQHQITLSLLHSQLEPKRGNEKSIMQCAYEYQNTVQYLCAINRVRMLHNVVRLVDICQANGSGMDLRYL